nr:papain-like cysteine protease family protein [Methylomarinum sp. Ch1-1]MDP4522328.1 papain-like cysteine protease family protein [Methylomarinum sp. Ch1-1]
MGYCLNVPFVTQLGIGSHVKGVNPIDDPTGCWYASACMVGYSFEAGPRLGVPELYTLPLKQNAKGKVLQYGHYVINTAWMPTLKAREQLVDVDEPTNQEWTAKALIDELKKYGPIFLVGLKPTTARLMVMHRSLSALKIRGPRILKSLSTTLKTGLFLKSTCRN